MTGTANTKTTDEQQIRDLIKELQRATREKDVDASMANIDEGIVSFDVVNPLQHIGAAALRNRAETWFASFDGPIGYEIRDLCVMAGDQVGFAHGLSHVSAKRTDGSPLEMWWRTTFGFCKIDGKWMTTHEHQSVPFDVESGKASLDLEPSS